MTTCAWVRGVQRGRRRDDDRVRRCARDGRPRARGRSKPRSNASPATARTRSSPSTRPTRSAAAPRRCRGRARRRSRAARGRAVHGQGHARRGRAARDRRQPRVRRSRRRPPTRRSSPGCAPAGAVLVGKTNCPEFALQPRTDNRIFGPTLHPFDAEPLARAGRAAGARPRSRAGSCRSRSAATTAVRSAIPPHAPGSTGCARRTVRCRRAGTCPTPAAGTPRHRFQTVGPLARTPRDIELVFDVIPGGRTRRRG